MPSSIINDGWRFINISNSLSRNVIEAHMPLSICYCFSWNWYVIFFFSDWITFYSINSDANDTGFRISVYRDTVKYHPCPHLYACILCARGLMTIEGFTVSIRTRNLIHSSLTIHQRYTHRHVSWLFCPVYSTGPQSSCLLWPAPCCCMTLVESKEKVVNQVICYVYVAILVAPNNLEIYSLGRQRGD